MKQNVMKKCFGLLLVMGLGLTLKENTAMKAQAAEEKTQTNANAVVDLDFPVEGQGSTNRYNSSFSATMVDTHLQFHVQAITTINGLILALELK